MDLGVQIALTIAAAAGIWAWIIADWLPRQWVLSNDRSPAIPDETHRWIRRLEAGIACGVSAGIVGLLEVYVGLIDLL
jgi:hypothetical protein